MASNPRQFDRTVPESASEPTLTIERTARIMGLSRASAYEAARRGEIPSIRVGRRLLVPTAELRILLRISERVTGAA
jgi:excisionase family DNA binding protein